MARLQLFAMRPAISVVYKL